MQKLSLRRPVEVLFNSLMMVVETDVHIFLNDLSQKVNVIAQMEFELADYDVVVKLIRHCATGTPTQQSRSGHQKRTHHLVDFAAPAITG